MNAIARMSLTPLAAIQDRFSELMLDWEDRRDERRRKRELEQRLLQELGLIRADMRRGYRSMRFTRS
jgi:hypothetical protein